MVSKEKEKSPNLYMRDIATFRNNKNGFLISHRNGWLGNMALMHQMKRHNQVPKKAIERKFSYIKEIDPDYFNINNGLKSHDVTSYFGARYNDGNHSIQLQNLLRPCLRSNLSRSYLKYDAEENQNPRLSSLYIVFSRHPQAGRATFQSDGKPLIAAEMVIRHPDGLLRPSSKEIQKINYHKAHFPPLIIGQDGISYCGQAFMLSEAAYVIGKIDRSHVTVNASSVSIAATEIKEHDESIGKLMAEFYNASFVDFPISEKTAA